MSDSNDSNQNKIEEIITLIKGLEGQITNFSEVITKFGLDLITKLGQNKMSIKMLKDKVEKLTQPTIEIKGLLPQLNLIIESQKNLETEVELIKTLIQRSAGSAPSKEHVSDIIERDESVTDVKQSAQEQLNMLKERLDIVNDPLLIKNSLDNIKEFIFEKTGGHRILYEISQIVNKLNTVKSLTDPLKNEIKEKINFWINKL